MKKENGGEHEPILQDMIDNYNSSKKRFIYYPWGVWCTSYARRNLFKGIKAFGDDYCYSDTDSIKAINYQNHMDFIVSYNKEIKQKIDECLIARNLNPERSRPQNIKGEVKQLGVWDFEGVYQTFKTLGAKRYFVLEKDTYKITVAGLGKQKGAYYLYNGLCCDIKTHKLNFNPFEKFKEGLEVPPEFTGKNCHTYLDYEMTGFLKDYQGNVCEYSELSGCHIEPISYNLSLADEYIKYLFGFRNRKEGL